LIKEFVELEDFNLDFVGFLNGLEVVEALVGETVANILVHVELERAISLLDKPLLPIRITPSTEHTSQMLESVSETLLLSFLLINITLLNIEHSPLDVQFYSSDLGLSELSIFLLDSNQLSSVLLRKIFTTSTDLVAPSLKATIFFGGLSGVFSIKLTFVALVILSVETHLVLLVTETLTGVALSLDQSGTSLGIGEFVEVGLLVPSGESWTFLVVALDACTSIDLISLHERLGGLASENGEISDGFLLLSGVGELGRLFLDLNLEVLVGSLAVSEAGSFAGS